MIRMASSEQVIQNKGIIPNVVGGLGNQLFIVAAAYVASKIQQVSLYIAQNPIDHEIANRHNHNKQDYNQSIFSKFGIQCQITLPDLSSLIGQGYTEFSPKGFAEWSPADVKAGTIMNSYFQYWPALKPFEHSLREIILEGLQPNLHKIQQQFDTTNAVFIHVRRGDYLKYPNFHYGQTVEDYYKPALATLREKVSPSNLYVLSDDMDWVKSQPCFAEMTLVDLPNELDALALMASCTAGAVLANSTFSWWGAFLGAYAHRSPVMVPRKWIGEPITCLFPEGWIVV